jgi:hypothetical protein
MYVPSEDKVKLFRGIVSTTNGGTVPESINVVMSLSEIFNWELRFIDVP